MKQIINMWTDSKGITRTLSIETEQTNKRLEIDVDLELSQPVKGSEPLHLEKHMNLSVYEAARLIDALLPIVKPNKRIITVKQK